MLYGTKKENRMGTQPVPRLLLGTAVPLMLSLLVNSLYNVVDSIFFVSRVNEAALTALSLAAPVQTIMSALGCGVAVGLNAAISKAMGEHNREKVRETASAAMLLSIGAYLLIALACVLGVRPYFAWQAAGQPEIAAYGVDYLQVCMLFSFGQMAQWVFDRFLIATGRPMLFLVTLSTASVTKPDPRSNLDFRRLWPAGNGYGGRGVCHRDRPVPRRCGRRYRQSAHEPGDPDPLYAACTVGAYC